MLMAAISSIHLLPDGPLAPTHPGTISILIRIERERVLWAKRRMRPITTHATRTVPIPRPMTQPRVAVPEKALSQPYTDCSPESRVGRYGVALAFSKANVQRSRAASRAEFGKGGCGGWKRQQRMRPPRRQLCARRRLTGAPHWINRQLAGYAARRFGAGLTAWIAVSGSGHKATPPRAGLEHPQVAICLSEAAMQVALSRSGFVRHFGELPRKVGHLSDQPFSPIPFFQALLTFVFKVGPQLIGARFDFNKPRL
jgi:hypothetical protein